MKIFLDANVLFTAAYSPAGVARALFDLADAGHCSSAPRHSRWKKRDEILP